MRHLEIMTARTLKVANVMEEGRYGGPQVQIAMIAERLRPCGIETTVICPRRDSDALRRELEARGVICLPHNLNRLSRHLHILWRRRGWL